MSQVYSPPNLSAIQELEKIPLKKWSEKPDNRYHGNEDMKWQ